MEVLQIKTIYNCGNIIVHRNFDDEASMIMILLFIILTLYRD